MDKLEELIRLGPDHRYTMKALVLERHADISDARRLMRTWSDIADALGLSRARSKDLAGCFARVEKGIRAGKLMTGRGAAGGHTQRAGGNGRSGIILDNSNNSSQQPKGASGRIDLDDPANQL